MDYQDFYDQQHHQACMAASQQNIWGYQGIAGGQCFSQSGPQQAAIYAPDQPPEPNKVLLLLEQE